MKYLKGLFVKSPHANAPDFILAKISINRKTLIETLQGMGEDYIDLDVKKGKDGDVYAQIDDWKPEGRPEATPPKEDDLPF